MKFAEGQLKETLKILAYEFVNSVQKMYSLHQEHLHSNKEQLYSRILQTIEVQSKPFLVVDDCEKILENSYEEKMKNECFEKDFSISIQNHSVSKQSHSFDQSDCFDHRKDSFDQSDEKLKKILLNRHQAYEITQYNHEPNQNFFVVENLADQIKTQELKASEELDEENEEEENFQSQLQSDDSDYQNSSLNRNTTKIQTQSRRKPIAKKFKFTKKKYRSYTQLQRQEAINHAKISGLDFTSRLLQIPKKNITRWMKRKQKRQKIRGRKPSDPDMEQNLTNWVKQNIKEGNYLTQSQIRSKARTFSVDNSFKASKGWLEKYFRRNRSISDGLNGLLITKRIKMAHKKNENTLEPKQQDFS